MFDFKFISEEWIILNASQSFDRSNRIEFQNKRESSQCIGWIGESNLRGFDRKWFGDWRQQLKRLTDLEQWNYDVSRRIVGRHRRENIFRTKALSKTVDPNTTAHCKQKQQILLINVQAWAAASACAKINGLSSRPTLRKFNKLTKPKLFILKPKTAKHYWSRIRYWHKQMLQLIVKQFGMFDEMWDWKSSFPVRAAAGDRWNKELSGGVKRFA